MIPNLRAILQGCCTKETSASVSWQDNDPLKGHCDLIALIVQNLRGGEIIRGTLNYGGRPRGHFWNQLPNGSEVDFCDERYESDPHTRLTKEGIVNLEEFRMEHLGTSRYNTYHEKVMRLL